jgi:hypothetical protein
VDGNEFRERVWQCPESKDAGVVCVFFNHLQHVTSVWKLEDATHKQLVSLFDTKDDNCVVMANPEICFCFWAFTPSTQAWLVL